MKRQGISLEHLSGYYDRLTLTEKSKFRRKQIAMAEIRTGEKILDVGCGTGPLSILAAINAGKSGEVHAIDIAPAMMRKARIKAERFDLDIRFTMASIASLPYTDCVYDLVISSLMFHHLPVGIKRAGLAEVYRVLKPGGRFFLSDFGTPHPLGAPLLFPLMIWISPTRYQLLGGLGNLFGTSGFREVTLRKTGIFFKYYVLLK